MTAAAPPLLPADARRIVIVCPSWVGDTVMATPTIRAVRRHRPDARIITLGRPGLDDLLEGCPWIDERIALTMKGALGPFRAAQALRATGADAALLLPNSFRSALTVRLGGIPCRIGYDRDGRGRLLTARVPVQRRETPTPAIDYYLHLAAAALADDDLARGMELFVSDAQRDAADALLADVPEHFVILNPGGNKLPKRWPPESFAAVADALHDDPGLGVVVSGAPGEADVLAAVVDAARAPVVNIAGPGLNLGTLKAIAQRAALMITNDTGPRHIAAALGTPVVTLFGPTDHRWTTLGLEQERLLLAEPFLPGERVADAHADLCRIERIAVGDVVAAARALLGAAS
jgi:heptosyltransferase-2